MSRSDTYSNAKVAALIDGQISLSGFSTEDFADLALAALDQAGLDRKDQNTVSKLLAEYDLESAAAYQERTGEPRGAGEDWAGRSVAEGDFCE